MYQKILPFIVILLATLVFSGCVAPNIQLTDTFWQNHNQKIAVAVTKAPKPGLYQKGEVGLLDYAITNIVNSKFERHLKTTDLSWYYRMPEEFTEQLRLRHMDAKAYPEPLNPSQVKYFYQMDGNKLVFKLEAVGASRSYYGFVPTGEPVANCILSGELIDPRNKVLWRYKAIVGESVRGTWDQPPNYPNLTHALTLAMQEARQELLDSFFTGLKEDKGHREPNWE
jgi:hypothetical protein